MQSSTFKKQVASLAVDGDYETASCTAMESDKPWWAVDLGWGLRVNYVTVTTEQYVLNYGELIIISKYVSALSLASLYPTFTKSFAVFVVLLQRVSIACYAERCIRYDTFRPSVCLSVTVWYHVKITPATIMRSSLKDNPMTLVSSILVDNFIAKFITLAEKNSLRSPPKKVQRR